MPALHRMRLLARIAGSTGRRIMAGAGIGPNTLQEDFVVGFIDIDRGIGPSKFGFSVDWWPSVFKAIVNKGYSAGDASGHVKVRLYRLGCPESNVDMYEANRSRHVLVIDTSGIPMQDVSWRVRPGSSLLLASSPF